MTNVYTMKDWNNEATRELNPKLLSEHFKAIHSIKIHMLL